MDTGTSSRTRQVERVPEPKRRPLSAPQAKAKAAANARVQPAVNEELRPFVSALADLLIADLLRAPPGRR